LQINNTEPVQVTKEYYVNIIVDDLKSTDLLLYNQDGGIVSGVPEEVPITVDSNMFLRPEPVL